MRPPLRVFVLALCLAVIGAAALQAAPPSAAVSISSASANMTTGELTIEGNNFGTTPPTIILGGYVLTATVWGPSQLVAMIPAAVLASPGDYALSVIRGSGSQASTGSLVVTIGATGPAGPAGPAGANGATGPQGPAGANGATGPQGPAGANGATGSQGPAGANGATGAQGPAGANGAVGPTGPQGAAGPAGAVGPTGAAGPAGVNGAVGPTGPAGVNGAVGPTGPAGAQGISNAYVTAESSYTEVGSTIPVTVDSLALPAGKFVLSAVVQAYSENGGTVQCKLINSTNVGSGSYSGLHDHTSVEVPVMGYADLASPATVSVECQMVAGGFSYIGFARMSAMQVGTLNVQ